MASFETGLYFILMKDGSRMSRSPIEDMSLMPKPLYVLGQQAAMASHPVSLENKGEDGYVMRAGGSDVGMHSRKDVVAAALIPGMDCNVAKVEFKEVEGGYKILFDQKYLVKGDTGPAGHYLKQGSESDALVFRIVPYSEYS